MDIKMRKQFFRNARILTADNVRFLKYTECSEGYIFKVSNGCSDNRKLHTLEVTLI